MKTRQQYLSGECTHEEYYNQFVDERVKRIVLNRFKKEDLIKAYERNQSFNAFPLPVWDSLAQNIRFKSEDVKATGDYLTLAGSVCILKAAARLIVTE
jgi:hypothetical protein